MKKDTCNMSDVKNQIKSGRSEDKCVNKKKLISRLDQMGKLAQKSFFVIHSCSLKNLNLNKKHLKTTSMTILIKYKSINVKRSIMTIALVFSLNES